MELISFDVDDPGPELGAVSATERMACPTLAQLREWCGGERGGLTDPWGNEHVVVLSDWPTMDPHKTRVLIRFHRVPDSLTAPAVASP